MLSSLHKIALKKTPFEGSLLCQAFEEFENIKFYIVSAQ